jgi:CheY-like chemotaxis protein
MASQIRPLNFLLVDDDPLILIALSDLLQDMGHTTINADHPDVALARFAEGPPIDVMVTDIKLPSMNGHELAAKIRHIAPELKIIFTSGYDQEKLGATLHDPLVRCLQKPFGKKEIDDALLSMGLIEI